jgi:hypothetical protein
LAALMVFIAAVKLGAAKAERPAENGALARAFAKDDITAGPRAHEKSCIEDADQIRLIKQTNSARAVLPGVPFSVHIGFVAASAPLKDYSLEVSLVDSGGKLIVKNSTSLKDDQFILPTKSWIGPIALSLPLTPPRAFRGAAKILVTVTGGGCTIRLSKTSQVSPDKQGHYELGRVVVGTASTPLTKSEPEGIDLKNYDMTFDEEFTALSISNSAKNDGSTWYAQNEQCCMMASDKAKTEMAPAGGAHNPFYLADQKGLIINLHRVADLWSSGVLTTVDSKGLGFSQQYGYFEMRAKFPKGEDTWPAFWMLSTAAKQNNAPAGEIDIVEYIANPAFSHFVATTLHDWSDKSTPAMSHYAVPLPSDGFHKYGMSWTATTMTFLFDNVVMFQCPTPKIMHQPYYLIVDLGLGGGWPTQNTPAENEMNVDYIRAYRLRPAN